MKILGINFSHEASVCVIDGNDIVFYQEEQMLSGVKKDHRINYLWNELKNNYFDSIVFTRAKVNQEESEELKKYIIHSCDQYNITFKNIRCDFNHHLQHAASSFYNSPFDKAYCLVMDGSGNHYYFNDEMIGSEIESIFKIDKNKIELKWKVCNGIDKTYSDNIHSIQSISPGLLFKFIANCIGSKEPGAVMGMSAYSNKLSHINAFYKQGDLFKVNQNFMWHALNQSIDKFYYTKSTQYESTEIVKYRINKILEKDPDANICLSGGFFQNCQANYEVLNLTKNIFVDPISHDGGTAMGCALLEARDNNIKVKPYSNLYLGIEPTYPDLKTNTNYTEISKLIKQNNLVAIFQGRPEGGPRALGNRSLLFNAENSHAKEIVNKFKKREWYRPYAGSVLQDKVKSWFDLNGKKETPFMSYATKVLNNKVPGITHVDNTCRVQTVKQKDNYHFYKLLKEHHKQYSMPVMLNTSLNIAGKPIVATFKQLMEMFHQTDLKYIYLPDKQHLIKK